MIILLGLITVLVCVVFIVKWVGDIRKWGNRG